MADDHGGRLAKRLDHADAVAGQVDDAVGLDLLGRFGRPIAPDVDGGRPVTGGGEGHELVPPRVPRLGEAVDEQDEGPLAHLGHVDAHAVGIDIVAAKAVDLHHGGHPPRSRGAPDLRP